MEPENGRRQRRRLASRHARHVRPRASERARSIGRWSPPCTHAARYSGSRILGTGAGTLAWPSLAARAVPSRTCPAVVRTARARAVSLRGPARGQALRRGRGAPTRLPALTCAIVYRPFAHARSQRRAAPRRAAHSKVETRLARSRPTEGNRCPQASPTRGPGWDRVPCVRVNGRPPR